MKKKVVKKSWRKHNVKGCGCFHCVGDYLARLISKTRVRKKYNKHRNNINYEKA